MKLIHLLALALLSQVAASPSSAQSTTAYAGQHTRGVKAYSDAEVADLLAGRGMGLARPAELNAYPGPQHVLELADKLNLTPAQRAATEALMPPMRAAAQKHGAELIARERELDALFAEGHATPERVRAALDAAALAQARVRQAHLDAHIAQRAILSAEQIATYQKLRGYDGSSGSGGHGHHGKQHDGKHHGGMRGRQGQQGGDAPNKPDSASEPHKH